MNRYVKGEAIGDQTLEENELGNSDAKTEEPQGRNKGKHPLSRDAGQNAKQGPDEKLHPEKPKRNLSSLSTCHCATTFNLLPAGPPT